MIEEQNLKSSLAKARIASVTGVVKYPFTRKLPNE